MFFLNSLLINCFLFLAFCFVGFSQAQELVSDSLPSQEGMAVSSGALLPPALKVEESSALPLSEDSDSESLDSEVDLSSQGSPEDDLELSDEELFFDAESLVPKGELARKSGPRKVDPKLEPGSRYVVVRRNSDKDSEQSMFVSAQRAIDLGRYGSALEILDRLYAENNDNPNVLLGRAVALHKMDRFDEAIKAYEELLEKNPDNLEAQINMLGLMGARYPSVALQRIRSLYENNSSNPKLIAQIAVLLGRIGNFEEALRYLGVAASIDSKNPMHLYNMGVIADKMNDKIKAIDYYEEALQLDTVYGGGGVIPREAVFSRLADLR